MRIAMTTEWHDERPIYRQLQDLIIAGVMDGVLVEGDAIPSIRTVAADYRVNPVTVLKAYQALADELLIESRRGRGFFVSAGARTRLLERERLRFLREEWPRVHAMIQRLGLSLSDLLDDDAAPSSTTGAPRGARR